MGLTGPIIKQWARKNFVVPCYQASFGWPKDSTEVAIRGNGMGATQELLEGCQLFRNIKPSGALSCSSKACFFQVDESIQLLSQETPHIPSYRRKKWGYTQLDLNYQGIAFVCLSSQWVKYQSVLSQKLKCSIRLEPFSILLLKFSCRNHLQDMFLLCVHKALLR